MWHIFDLQFQLILGLLLLFGLVIVFLAFLLIFGVERWRIHLVLLLHAQEVEQIKLLLGHAHSAVILVVGLLRTDIQRSDVRLHRNFVLRILQFGPLGQKQIIPLTSEFRIRSAFGSPLALDLIQARLFVCLLDPSLCSER